jgi:hypothetical protein
MGKIFFGEKMGIRGNKKEEFYGKNFFWGKNGNKRE